MTKNTFYKNSQAGFTLIELVMVLAVFSVMLPALLMYVRDSNLLMTQKAAASFMKQLVRQQKNM